MYRFTNVDFPSKCHADTPLWWGDTEVHDIREGQSCCDIPVFNIGTELDEKHPYILGPKKATTLRAVIVCYVIPRAA